MKSHELKAGRLRVPTGDVHRLDAVTRRALQGSLKLPRPRYTVNSYSRAVAYALERANTATQG